MAELKNALRIDVSVTADDTLLADCISSATSTLEKTFGLAFVTQTWKLWLDKWPMKKDWVPPYSSNNSNYFSLSEIREMSPAIGLSMFPVQSITSFTVYDQDNNAVPFDSANYFLDTSMKSSRVVLNNFASWPVSSVRQAKVFEILFVAGFATIPADIKMAVLSYAMSLYQARGCSSAIPAGVYTALQTYSAARL